MNIEARALRDFGSGGPNYLLLGGVLVALALLSKRLR
jgi:hypothetical protein